MKRSFEHVQVYSNDAYLLMMYEFCSCHNFLHSKKIVYYILVKIEIDGAANANTRYSAAVC